VSLHIGVEVKVKEFLFHRTECSQLGNPGVGEDDIDLPVGLLDCLVQPIKVGQVGNVALYSDYFPTNLAPVLEEWSLPPMDLWVIYPSGRLTSAKARAFVKWFEKIIGYAT
jgi:hypothetical protein